MSITLTPRLGLTQWGQGADPPSRTAFNGIFAAIDANVAIDDGTSPNALPTSGVNGQALSNGRYAHVVSGSNRQLYRRAGGVWAQVGGNTWNETRYDKAAAAAPTSDPVRVVSHPSLTTATATESWDGTTVRGNRQAVGDLNTGQPGAVHVGDTTTAVSLAVRGRVWAKAANANERGFVATAGVAGAGNLFTALDSTGAEPWSVSSSGQVRAQAAGGYGGSSPVAGVPITAMAGASDASAMDLYANAGKPALRIWRAQGDTTPIASLTDTVFTLGRSPWTGGSIGLVAPNVGVTGAFAVTGAASVTGAVSLASTLGVTGLTTLAGLNAGTTGLGATTAANLAVTAGATIGTTLGVSGATSLGGTLGVTGATTLAGLSAGATSLTSTLAVAGATTLAALTANGLAQLKASAQVTGTLSVSSDTTLSGRLGLPTSRPSGTAAGQLRIASDWTPEVFDGSVWRGKFGADSTPNASGRKHYWTANNVAINGSDTFAQVTALIDATSPQGTVASMSSGSLYLNAAGLWSITASFFVDSGKDGIARLRLIWTNGAFAGRDTITDSRCRQITTSLGQSGNAECVITWVGWVDSASAANPLQMWIANRTSDGSTTSTTVLTMGAEYLGR